MNENTQTTVTQAAPSAPAVPKKPATIREQIESPKFAEQIAKVLPKILSPERFVRVAITAMLKTPKLAECTQASLLNSLLQLAQYGLEPDGRRAHLIPYKDQCTLIIDYKGIAELVMRSGLVSYLHADIVCENDVFEWDMGEIKKHTINLKTPRGEAYAFYALCRFKDGTIKAEVMHRDEVEAIRKRSRAGTSGPWVTDFNEMAKKTAFRRLSKWLPLSPEVRDATENDDDVIEIDAKATTKRDTVALSDPLDPFALVGADVQGEVAQ
jgi:recombination protein RecT